MKALKWKQRNSSQITLLLSFYLSDLNLITKSSQLCIWVRKGNCTWFNHLLPAQVFIQTVNQTVYTDKSTFTFCLFLFTVQPLKFGWPWPVLAFYRTKYHFFSFKVSISFYRDVCFVYAHLVFSRRKSGNGIVVLCETMKLGSNQDIMCLKCLPWPQWKKKNCRYHHHHPPLF